MILHSGATDDGGNTQPRHISCHGVVDDDGEAGDDHDYTRGGLWYISKACGMLPF